MTGAVGTDRGRRATVLLTFGVMWALVIAQYPSIDFGATRWGVHADDLLYLRIPEAWRAFAWGLTGAIGVAGALWPVRLCVGWFCSDNARTCGYVAIVLMPILRASSWLSSWLVDVWPGDPEGVPDAWRPAVLWLGLICLIVTCSGWREPPRLPSER